MPLTAAIENCLEPSFRGKGEALINRPAAAALVLTIDTRAQQTFPFREHAFY